MPSLTLQINPQRPALGLLAEPQLCYILATVGAQGVSDSRPVNWALVADASRSMRIPIVDEAQFRELLREGAAQETLVDGVPVWQLSGPVPAEIRAAAPSALEFVARALHSVVERLDDHDRFALVACAEDALLLIRSTSGAERPELVRGIARLKTLNLGELTDLARGIDLALAELRRGRAAPDGERVDRLLLLTDGFTERPEECLRLARAAAAEGVAISTIGLGGEFQEDVLTGMADRSAGRAVFLRRPDGIPRAIADELSAARAIAARAVRLRAALAPGVRLRRVTRIRPTLTPLTNEARAASEAALPDEVRLGDIAADAPVTLLIELLAPPRAAGPAPLGRLVVDGEHAASAGAELLAVYQAWPAAAPAVVLEAAARANAVRLHARAIETATRGDVAEAARLMRAAAARLDSLGEPALAQIARGQAAELERGGAANPLAAKELAYATRRLGGQSRSPGETT